MTEAQYKALIIEGSIDDLICALMLVDNEIDVTLVSSELERRLNAKAQERTQIKEG